MALEGPNLLELQLYRTLWMYVALYDLARTHPGKIGRTAWPVTWRQAAMNIAHDLTPLLVAGGEMDIEQVEAGAFPADRNTVEKSSFLGLHQFDGVQEEQEGNQKFIRQALVRQTGVGCPTF